MHENLKKGIFTARTAVTGELTPFCPDDRIISGWYESRLQADERRKVSNHLSDCSYCRHRVGMLSRLEGDFSAEDVPGSVLARAKQIPGIQPRRSPQRLAAWATAAAAVVAIGLFALIGKDSGGLAVAPGDTSMNGTALRELRSIGEPAQAPEIIRPEHGQELQADALAVSWKPLNEALEYEVQIIDETGRLLLNERVDGTDWQARTDPGLEPHTAYFLRINARLVDGRTVGSKHRSFTVSSRDIGE